MPGQSDEKSEKFNVHPNSIEARFQDLSPELQAKYFKNRKQLAGDASSLEIWKAKGFRAGSETED